MGAHARQRARRADGFVIFEIDVPDDAVIESQSWWWAEGQLLLPLGCEPAGILSVHDLDLREEPA